LALQSAEEPSTYDDIVLIYDDVVLKGRGFEPRRKGRKITRGFSR